MVSAKVGVTFVNIVMLEGVHGTSDAELLADGMLLT